MSAPLSFLPAPRFLTLSEGAFSLPAHGLILLDAPTPQRLRSSAARLQAALLHYSQSEFEYLASDAPLIPPAAITLRIAPDLAPHPQGFRLHITPHAIAIDAHDPAGVFYGVCTLIQILQQAGNALPTLEITDWPDFPARGVMLDISRDKVYRMDTLYALTDRLASWKINQLQLYTEHTFAYRNHPDAWGEASPLTAQEIMDLDVYCRERFIELVPNQNSFGHLTHWLTKPRYAPLAEIHGKFSVPWGEMEGPFSLAPENAGSLPLIQSMYDELLPNFTSRLFNVGCDETFDLGAGASKEICQTRGTGQVYLDYLLKIYADVKQRGFTMQFWGDIILQHPELVPALPRDVIALSWGYEAGHPFDREGQAFASSGVPFYVCPGTSAWNTLSGRTTNALGNLLNAAENGLKYGAIGYLNTDWGDNGHWQTPPISYLGFAAGAALSWAVDTNRAADWANLLSLFAFDDPSGSMGKLAYDLGEVYRVLGLEMPNSSPLFWVFTLPLAQIPTALAQTGVDADALTRGMLAAQTAIDRALQPLSAQKMTRPDADLIRREFANTARLMRHACRRATLALNEDSPAERAALTEDMRAFLEEYRTLWLLRNRPGGLPDSTARFEAILQEYQA